MSALSESPEYLEQERQDLLCQLSQLEDNWNKTKARIAILEKENRKLEEEVREWETTFRVLKAKGVCEQKDESK